MNIYQQILTRYWGYSDFRPVQEDIIKSVAAGHDTLGLLPTGGGKSVTFQVPTLAGDGMCLVITPLIALMKDQVEKLNQMGIRAIALHSGMSKDEIDIGLNNAIFGDFKFLYVSPERLSTQIFRVRLPQMNITLVTIDEAHCISQWGYDFRPSYMQIARLREEIPEVPFLALTATATKDVVTDIQEKLKFKEKNVLRASFERKNLVYTVKNVEDKERYLQDLLTRLQGSGIVYARSRKKTREFSELLRKVKISADYYHAGLSPESRSRKQTEWMRGRTRVIVATNAFGMGIDKPDVRFVVHVEMPDSVEAYFQEAGRAGRDNKTAHAILLYSPSDRSKVSMRVQMNYPEIDEIKQIYRALGNYYQLPVGSGKNQVFDFNVAEFAGRYKHSILTIYSSLKFLQMEGYVELTDEIFNPSKIKFHISRDELYRFQIANVDFDAFIKLVLRTYTGLFTDYVTVYEESLARQADVKIDLIIKYLKRLDSMGVIRYIPQKKTPVIIYTEERLDVKNLHISKEHYQDRKKQFSSRMEAMLDYASGISRCRSLFLLAYFGEKGKKRCGHCDVCMQESELNLPKFEFDYIAEKIQKKLESQPMLLDDLVRDLGGSEDKNIRVLRNLLDNNVVQRLLDERISWEG